ncbi:hypothetical protein [Nocardia asteroides]|uniref:hypothetical protein n=1 Tax=Nocardia asteroides TaxID=1824 RepID=UPI001E4E3810|nr:hypothetical protein [Nocardia asteroides]UGT53344.1 hypothetical protein LTT85_21990 [Nocardia asteroides]
MSLLSPSLITGALAVTVIVLVQGAGVAEAAPNPDGSRARIDRDFCAQGVGNVFSALRRSNRLTNQPIRAQPTGG